MSGLKEIEEAIERLPRDAAFELGVWLEKKLATDWDEQFQSDAKAGNLDGLAERALAEHRAGKSTDFPAQKG